MPWLTSKHAIRATLSRGEGRRLYLTKGDSRNSDLRRLAEKAGIEICTVSASGLRREAGPSARGAALEIADSSSHPLQVELKDWLRRNPAGTSGPILALDHITDPQNVGAILRTAHLFGVSLVIVPARRSVFGGEGVLRSSAGAADRVPLSIVSNLSAALRACRASGWWTYVADIGGTPLPDVHFQKAAVIVMGAEGKGVSPVVGAAADVTVTIPNAAPPDTTVDSFNVSVAAGIVLYQWHAAHR